MQCLGNWNLSAKVMFKAWCQCAKSCLSVREVLKPNGQLERAGADAGPQGRGRGGLQGAGQGWCANLTGHTRHSGYTRAQMVQMVWRAAHHGWTLSGRPRPMGARRTESEAGEGRSQRAHGGAEIERSRF